MCVTELTEEGNSVVNIVNFTRFLNLSPGVHIPIIVTYLSLPHCSFLVISCLEVVSILKLDSKMSYTRARAICRVPI